MVLQSVAADAVERRFLVGEHREIVNGLAAIPELAAQVGPFPPADLAWMVGDVLRWLQSSLEPHTACEEAWLYPQLEAGAGSATLLRLLCFDHEQIRAAIAEIERQRARLASVGTDMPSHELPRLLFGLEAIIRAHLQREDRFLLPLLDAPMARAPEQHT